MKSVGQLLANKQIKDVYTIEADQPVFEAVKLMAEKNIGALPVMDQGNVIGVVSERDYARKMVLQGRSSIGTPVREIMNSPVETVSPQMKIEECMNVMTDCHYRHLPVVDEAGQLVGLVSIGDVVKEAIAEQAALIRQMEQYIRGEH